MRPPCLSLLFLLAAVVHAQDVIVATETGLLIVNSEGSRKLLEYESATAVTGFGTVPLAADSCNSRVFYSLPQLSPEGQKISRLLYVNVHPGTSPNPQPVALLYTGTLVGHIRGLAYNEVSGILYWTNMLGHSIWQCTITGGCRDAKLIKRLNKDKEPAAIAVHPSRGYLFWTNNNHTSPSIFRMDLNSRRTIAIATTGLFMPNGIAVDATERGRIYWTDDSEGDLYKIESAELNGAGRRVEHRGYHQAPMDLTFSPPTDERPKGALYWSDWTGNTVWTLDLDDPSKGARELPWWGGHWDRPMGVVTRDSLQYGAYC